MVRSVTTVEHVWEVPVQELPVSSLRLMSVRGVLASRSVRMAVIAVASETLRSAVMGKWMWARCVTRVL